VFESVDDASQTVSDIIAMGMIPGAIEMMDQLITRAVEEAYHFGFPLDAGAVLIVELDGLAAVSTRKPSAWWKSAARTAHAKCDSRSPTKNAPRFGNAASAHLARLAGSVRITH
jgi:hypothetical protein